MFTFDEANFAQAAQSTEQLISLGGTMNDLKQMQANIEEYQTKTDWLKTAVGVVSLLDLIESTLCIIERLNSSIQINTSLGQTMSCYRSFQLEFNLTRIALVVDQLSSVLSAMKMSTGERLNNVNNATEEFGEAQKDLENLNKEISKDNYRIKKREEYEAEAANYRDYVINR